MRDCTTKISSLVIFMIESRRRKTLHFPTEYFFRFFYQEKLNELTVAVSQRKKLKSITLPINN